MPNVHGEQSAATVEYRGERGHERCHHYCDHQTSHTYKTMTVKERIDKYNKNNRNIRETRCCTATYLLSDALMFCRSIIELRIYNITKSIKNIDFEYKK